MADRTIHQQPQNASWAANGAGLPAIAWWLGPAPDASWSCTTLAHNGRSSRATP